MEYKITSQSLEFKEIVQQAEKNGWSVSVDDGFVTFSLNEVTEDYNLELPINDMYKELVEYYANFDPEEHCEFWCHVKYEGTVKGIPSVSVLLKEAYIIDKKLEELGKTMYDVLFGEHSHIVASSFVKDVIDYEYSLNR